MRLFVGPHVTVCGPQHLEGRTPDNPFPSAIGASARGEGEGAGDAGEILIEAQQVSLSGGAQIISLTFGPGNGGTVTVRATEVSLDVAAHIKKWPGPQTRPKWTHIRV